MLVADMKMNEFNFNRLTAQLSSGNKYQNITDNPIASVNILKISSFSVCKCCCSPIIYSPLIR